VQITNTQNRFVQLVRALEDGWEIEEPVILGALWANNAYTQHGIYHFILRKQQEDKTTLLSLPLSSQLLIFLSENNMQINTC